MRLLVVLCSPPLDSLLRPVAGWLEDKRPPTGAGVTDAGAIGEKLNIGAVSIGHDPFNDSHFS